MRAIFAIRVDYSDSEKGLYYYYYVDEFTKYFKIDKKGIINLLPEYEVTHVDAKKGEWVGGYFSKTEQIDEFLEKIRKISNKQ